MPQIPRVPREIWVHADALFSTHKLSKGKQYRYADPAFVLFLLDNKADIKIFFDIDEEGHLLINGERFDDLPKTAALIEYVLFYEQFQHPDYAAHMERIYQNKIALEQKIHWTANTPNQQFECNIPDHAIILTTEENKSEHLIDEKRLLTMPRSGEIDLTELKRCSDLMIEKWNELSDTQKKFQEVIISLDFDDTIQFHHATTLVKEHVLNKHLIDALKETIKKFRGAGIEPNLQILSSRGPDKVMVENYHTVRCALELLIGELKNLGVEIEAPKKNYTHCLHTEQTGEEKYARLLRQTAYDCINQQQPPFILHFDDDDRVRQRVLEFSTDAQQERLHVIPVARTDSHLYSNRSFNQKLSEWRQKTRPSQPEQHSAQPLASSCPNSLFFSGGEEAAPAPSDAVSPPEGQTSPH